MKMKDRQVPLWLDKIDVTKTDWWYFTVILMAIIGGWTTLFSALWLVMRLIYGFN